MDSATLAVVSVAMCSELGPVLTGLMVAGRVGAAIAAEIGTMRVTEQIDALRTLAAHPVDYLVVPRFLAMFLVHAAADRRIHLASASLPLTWSASFLLGINPTYAWYQHDPLHRRRSTSSRASSRHSFLAAIIAIVSCYKGLNCPQGAEGVGHATTEAVVYSSITILISNFFLTLLLNACCR